MHFGLTNLTSALAADLVIFNSVWDRRSFEGGSGLDTRRQHWSDGGALALGHRGSQCSHPVAGRPRPRKYAVYLQVIGGTKTWEFYITPSTSCGGTAASMTKGGGGVPNVMR